MSARQSTLLVGLFALAICSVRCGGCQKAKGPGGGSDNPQADGGPNDGGGLDGGNPDGGDAGSPQISVGPGGFSVDGGPTGGSGDGVRLGPDGGLVLDSNDVKLHFAWIANATAGTVSKFDTKTGNEVARYYSVVPRDGLGNTLSSVRGDQANSPSRTAIDLNGDVWIANRAPGLQGSVTKVANDIASCRHSLADGGTRTSMDLNGNGQIETDPASGEFISPTNFGDPTQYDDCVLFTTPVGSPGGGSGAVKARALAISAPPIEGSFSAGNIWVGIWSDRTVLKLESITGRQVPVSLDGGMQITLPAWGAYGAAVDGQQRLWIAAAPGDAPQAALALIDAKTGNLINGDIEASGIGSTSEYGIAIDGKDRVWLASWNTGPGAFRYDHGPGLSAVAGTWTRFDFPSARSQVGTPLGSTRGIAADDQGYIWASGHCPAPPADCFSPAAPLAQLIGFNGDDGGIYKFNLPDGGTADFIDATNNATQTYESIGVGLDSDNNIWVNNYGGSTGNAMKINRDGGTVFVTPSQMGNLYTYSDFTGYQLRHFTAPRGTYFRDFTGCAPLTLWGPVTWDAVTPPHTSIQLYVTVASSLAELNNTGLTQYGPYTTSPANLAGVPRNFAMRIKFVLGTTDPSSTPILNGYTVSFRCFLP